MRLSRGGIVCAWAFGFGMAACQPTDDAGGAGDAGAGGAPSEGCGTEGVGTLMIEVSGLPEGVNADVVLSAPSGEQTLTATTSLTGTAGTYAVAARRVVVADPIVRTVYDAVVAPMSVCVSSDAPQAVAVTYTRVPTSNHLWMPTDRQNELAGFASSALAAAGAQSPSVSARAPVGKAVAFDRDGNLWSLGPTLAEAMVSRVPASAVGASGEAAADVNVNVPEVRCLPAMRSLAFDGAGNLWLSVCGDRILRLPADSLSTSGDKVADRVIEGLNGNGALAFDAAGNLWVGSGGALVRFDASALTNAAVGAPGLTLRVSDALDPNRGLSATGLAFDAAGALWATDFGANIVYRVDAGALGGAGEQALQAHVSIPIGVSALLNSPAFDEGGGLWLGLGSGALGWLSPEQLATSVAAGESVTPARVLTTGAIGADLPVALYPAPAGLPLFHALP